MSPNSVDNSQLPDTSPMRSDGDAGGKRATKRPNDYLKAMKRPKL